MDGYYHGECVGLGMLKILNNKEIKDRLVKVLERLQLPLTCEYDADAVFQLMMNDKKADHDHISIVQVDEIGNGYVEDWSNEKIRERL